MLCYFQLSILFFLFYLIFLSRFCLLLTCTFHRYYWIQILLLSHQKFYAICFFHIQIGDFGILIRSGFSIPKALFFNFLSALVALAGTALVSVVFNSIFQISELFSGSTNGFCTQLTLKQKKCKY